MALKITDVAKSAVEVGIDTVTINNAAEALPEVDALDKLEV